MTLEDEITQGQDADMLLHNPAYQRAIMGVREGIISAMQQSAMGDDHTHNRLVIALQLLGQIERNIKTASETGKLARMQVEETKAQKLRRVVGF